MEDLIIYATILFVSLIYLLVGFGINKKNANYLLAGYNTMSDEQKEKFDIDSYLEFFKRFFKKLSLFPPVTYIVISIFLTDASLILVWSFLQSAPFIIFYRRSSKF